ncbi:hypothetical protein VTO42DRAFT_5015 [Malbranchea cinnamomea]
MGPGQARCLDPPTPPPPPPSGEQQAIQRLFGPPDAPRYVICAFVPLLWAGGPHDAEDELSAGREPKILFTSLRPRFLYP